MQRHQQRSLFLVALCMWNIPQDSNAAEWIDLSHTFDETTQYWPGIPGFNHSLYQRTQGDGYWFEMFNYGAVEHGGTHMDAPSHFVKGAWTVDQIPVERLVAHGAVIDLTERSAADRDTELTPNDLKEWKRDHGVWRYPTIIMINTGFAAFWNDRTRYFGIEPNITEVFETSVHFPGIGIEAARVITADPAVVGVGLDTPSLDPGKSKTFPSHTHLLGHNLYGLEHVADMSRLPPTGATIVSLPMKIGGGSGGPCRVLARLP